MHTSGVSAGLSYWLLYHNEASFQRGGSGGTSYCAHMYIDYKYNTESARLTRCEKYRIGLGVLTIHWLAEEFARHVSISIHDAPPMKIVVFHLVYS